MMKYIIRWSFGAQGDNYQVIEADTEEEADNAAYEAWRDDAESQADYEAMDYTEELAEDYGLED